MDFSQDRELANLDVEKLFEESKKNPEQIEEIYNYLKQRTQFYQDENTKLESALKKMQVLNHSLKMSLNKPAQIAFEQLADIQETVNSKHCTVEAVCLSHADRLRKHSNYIAKLKICIKVYTTLNENLNREIKSLKCDLKRSNAKVDELTFNKDDFKTLEIKIKRCENELTKFERKYPWLQDPQFNLPNISKEIETLVNLRHEKAKLVKELDVYEGLKPDIKEATQQLDQIKHEYAKVNKLFTK